MDTKSIAHESPHQKIGRMNTLKVQGVVINRAKYSCCFGKFIWGHSWLLNGSVELTSFFANVVVVIVAIVTG